MRSGKAWVVLLIVVIIAVILVSITTFFMTSASYMACKSDNTATAKYSKNPCCDAPCEVVRSEVEPNQNNTEEYTEYKINDFVDTKQNQFSTFATDVDTASYTVMRSKIEGGELPPTDSVRVEEYLNYFNYNYPAPSTGLFTVYAQIAENPFNNGDTKLLRVALKAREIKNSERRPAHLTFLIDVSGSMDEVNKLPLVIDTLRTLTNNLRPDDTIAICTYASRADIVLEPTRVENKKAIFAAFEPLVSGGSTAGEDGLLNAYKLAKDCFVKGDINRIIMCTDGDFNVGNTEGKSLAEEVNHYARMGITFSALGYGQGNYKDSTLEAIADAGNGNYFYIDSQSEINKVFGENLGSTLDVVAADTKIQLEFNPNIISKFRLVGYENRALTEEQFREDIVDAGDIGAGHSVTAIYELVMNNNPNENISVSEELENLAGIFRIRYKLNVTDEKAVEVSFPIENKVLKFQNADSSFKFATGVMGFADILRQSKYAEGWKLNTAIDCCRSGLVRSKDRSNEIVTLIKKAISLRDK